MRTSGVATSCRDHIIATQRRCHARLTEDREQAAVGTVAGVTGRVARPRVNARRDLGKLGQVQVVKRVGRAVYDE